MAENRKYSYKLEKRAGGRGLLSTVLAAVSIILFLALLTACAALKGKAGPWAGAVGLSGMLIAFSGVVTGLQSFHDRQRSYGFSKVGTIMNGILVAVWFILFCSGATA